jgi:hypothetical protein
MEIYQVESSYIDKKGCRLIWKGIDEDDHDAIVLNGDELENLIELLLKESTGKIELEDEFSTIWVNTDVTQFRLKEHKTLEVKTIVLRKKILEYEKIPHEPKPIKIYPKEFFPSITIDNEDDAEDNLLNSVLVESKTDISESDFFRVISTRRSTRKFDVSKLV